jgi:hypothetical protein
MYFYQMLFLNSKIYKEEYRHDIAEILLKVALSTKNHHL